MEERLVRTELLLGEEGIRRLEGSRVAIFGLGGVGGYAAEALARSGVGTLDLIDSDKVSESNLNRQIIATCETIGRYKVDVMRERILSVNPQARIFTHCCFYLPDQAERFPFGEYDYVVDAVDTVTAKIDLICRCKEAGTPVISAMGAGNKLDPSAFCVADIYETSVCPLARVMRRELRSRGIRSCKVVYSRETPRVPLEKERKMPGSVAFVPSVAGLIMAGEVIRDLSGV